MMDLSTPCLSDTVTAVITRSILEKMRRGDLRFPPSGRGWSVEGGWAVYGEPRHDEGNRRWPRRGGKTAFTLPTLASAAPRHDDYWLEVMSEALASAWESPPPTKIASLLDSSRPHTVSGGDKPRPYNKSLFPGVGAGFIPALSADELLRQIGAARFRFALPNQDLVMPLPLGHGQTALRPPRPEPAPPGGRRSSPGRISFEMLLAMTTVAEYLETF